MAALLTMVSLEVQPLRSSFGKVFMGAAGTPTGASDDEFNRVSFLSHFDGANNGVNNAFDDGSTNNHTITAAGNVTQGSFGPFARPDGEFGVSFDGTDDFLTVPDSTDFNIASDADFTLELWAFYSSFATQSHFVDTRASQGLNLTCSIGGGGTDDGKVKFFTNSDFRIITASTVPLGSWVHIALVRNSGTTKVYINGTADNNTYSDTHAYISGDWIIGKRSEAISGGSFMEGLFSNYRFVNGTAVYTSNFTPSTSKLTAITNTKLLTCQSNRFVDNSASGHTVTPSGGAAVSAFGPFLTSRAYDPAVNGASVYIAAGDSDYLSMPAQTIPTGSFTVEGWYYLDGTQSNSTIIAQGSSGNAARTFVGIEAVNGVQSLKFQIGSSLVNGPAAVANQWTHFCATYNGSAIELFQNGVSAGTTSRSGDAQNVAMVIGRLNTNWANSYGVKGYISNIRVSSVVRQSSNFTPPTSPLTNVDSNVKFLANMADGQAIDSAAQNNLTLYGTAKLSTGQAKFGGTSLLLDGNSDYAELTDTDVGNFGTGNFTIECWFRSDQFDSLRTLASKYTTVDGKRSWRLVFQSSSKLQLDITPDGGGGNIQNLETAATFNANTWYHLAVVRNGATISIYINGTADSNTLNYGTATVFTSPTSVLIGAQSNSSGTRYYFDGYIDDFRISNFARYTSNFTAPAEAFPDKGR